MCLDYCNSVAMNIEVYGCFQIIIFSRYMPRSGVAGSHFFFMTVFSFFVLEKVFLRAIDLVSRRHSCWTRSSMAVK